MATTTTRTNTPMAFQAIFPTGTRVLAFDEKGGMLRGVVTRHYTDDTGDGLTVRYHAGGWADYPYSLLDIERPSNSFVVVDVEA